MQCTDYVSHYKLDAEIFDYFEERSGPDRDSARRIQEAVMSEAGLAEGGIILDVGSGRGWLVKEEQLSRTTIVACDLSLPNLRKIRAAATKNFLPVVADAHRLPFRKNTFTRIIASEVIEHLNDPDTAVNEFFRVAQPDSRTIISTPYKEVLRTYLCIHCNRKSTVNAHIHSFDEKILTRIFSTAGFERSSFRRIQNKLFIMLRLSYLLRFLPYPLWRLCDAFFTLFFDKPLAIIFTAQKKSA